MDIGATILGSFILGLSPVSPGFPYTPAVVTECDFNWVHLLRFSRELARRLFPLFFSITSYIFALDSYQAQHAEDSTRGLDFDSAVILLACALAQH